MSGDVIGRDGVRVLVLDARGRLLLLNTCDPARPGMEWWELPGGGVRAGEGLEDAGRRELYEETGIVAGGFEGNLGEVEARFSFNGREYSQRESVLLLRVEEADVRATGFDGEVERAAHLGHRWWVPEEAFAAGLRLHPPELARLYAAATALTSVRHATPDAKGFWDEGPEGVIGGTTWDEPDRWRALVDGRECPICVRGAPLGVLVERPATWITSGGRVPVKGYVCVVAKRHVLEPYELPPGERAAFWEDVLFAAERVARLLQPIKVNYHIHGNSLPHLHAHIYPRFRGDRFVGGPIDARVEPVVQAPEELDRLRQALL